MSDNQFDDFLREKLSNHSAKVPEDMWERIEKKKDKDRKFILAPYYRIAAVLLISLAAGGYFVLIKQFADKPDLGRSIEVEQVEKPATENNTNNSSTTNNKNANADDLNSTQGLDKEFSKEMITRKAEGITKITAGRRLKTVDDIIIKEESDLDNIELNAENEDRRRVENPFKDHNTFSLEKESKSQNLENRFLEEKATATNQVQQIGTKKIKHTANKSLFIEAFASPEFAWKTTVINNSANNNLGFWNSQALADYIEEKKSSEKLLTSYSFGLRMSRQLSKRFSLKTGIHYTQFNERFSYVDNNVSRLIPVVTDRFVPDNATGAFVAVRDTSNFLQIGHIKKTTTNHYRSVNIPLLASYETGNENFKIAVTAGATINIYSWYNGFMLDSSSRAVPIKPGSGVYKTNTGVGLYVGVSAIKRINNGLEVFAEPHLQYNLSNITSKNVPYKQKINYAGISLGVRYNLFQTRQQ